MERITYRDDILEAGVIESEIGETLEACPGWIGKIAPHAPKPCPIEPEQSLEDEAQEQQQALEEEYAARCILCDFTLGANSGLSVTNPHVFPQTYGNAWIKDGICSVCLGEIAKHKKPATEPKWKKTYLTRDEKRRINTLRQQKNRHQLAEAECYQRIREIEAHSRARFLYLHQDKYEGPPRFQLSPGWIQYVDEHRRKTNTSPDPRLAIAEATDAEPPDEDDDKVEIDGDDPDPYDHSYSHGYGYHYLANPPREEPNQFELGREGLKRAGSRVYQATQAFEPILRAALKHDRQSERVRKAFGCIVALHSINRDVMVSIIRLLKARASQPSDS